MNSIIKLFEVSSNRSKGFFLIIATYFIFSIMELIAKDLGQRYDPLFIVFTRYVSQLIFLILLFNVHIINSLNLHYQIIINAIIIFGILFYLYRIPNKSVS